MNRSKIRDFLIVILFIILLICIGILGYRFYQYHQGSSIYNEAESLVNLPDLSEIDVVKQTMAGADFSDNRAQTDTDTADDQSASEAASPDPYAKALGDMDFAALREINSDVLGWIMIPNTVISYPLVQGADNDYYLNRTWKKSNSIVGSIYMDAQCSPDLSDFNTVIYGHRMNNGSMFGSLKHYKTMDYWNAHPNFIITNDDGVYVYTIFSAFEANLTDPVYMIKIAQEEEKQALIDCAVNSSVINTGIVPTTADQIVTLSTCTGRGHETRWIVVGVLDTFTQTE